jgi:hypothetical protein
MKALACYVLLSLVVATGFLSFAGDYDRASAEVRSLKAGTITVYCNPCCLLQDLGEECHYCYPTLSGTSFYYEDCDTYGSQVVCDTGGPVQITACIRGAYDITSCGGQRLVHSWDDTDCTGIGTPVGDCPRTWSANPRHLMGTGSCRNGTCSF